MLHELILIAELESASGLTRTEIVELVEYGVFEPMREPRDAPPDAWRFPDVLIGVARHAARLRSDFELSPPGLAMLLAYRERVRELERRVRELECRLPR
jgi:chaperone modulatory protein CbpM